MAMLKWTVEFSVDETWVADGFNMTAERAVEMLNSDLSQAYSHELAARILKAPTADRILKLQGYAPSTMTAAQKQTALSA